MNHTKIDSSLRLLEDAGIRIFTKKEVKKYYVSFLETIRSAIKNTDALIHGLKAIPTAVEPIKAEELQYLPNISRVMVGSCGGTNWIFSVGTRLPNGTVMLEEPFIKPIPEKERIHTFQSLVDLIADDITSVAREYHLLDFQQLPIAISLGFPQTNIHADNGDVDARISKKRLPKFWHIVDCDESLPPEQQPSLTALLREALLKRGFQSIGAIVFINDTVAVALDVQHNTATDPDLPVGFVFGTGTNAALYTNNTQGIVNLEAGDAEVIPGDRVFSMMVEERLVATKNNRIEYWMGGAYLPARVACALRVVAPILTDAEQISKRILTTSNQALLSEIAQENSPRQLEIRVGPSEYAILQEICRRVLAQAGQCIGIMIAAVSTAAGYTGGRAHIPYEGSLLAKGYNVEKYAMGTLRDILPNNEILPYQAKGVVGGAKLAMIKNMARNG